MQVKLRLAKLRLAKSLIGLIFLSYVPISQAQTEALPLDLIELLGELDDEDNALDTALSEIELEKSKETMQPYEVKND